PGECYLDFFGRGSFGNLSFVLLDSVPCNAGHVVVRAFASGLNFRDVLNVLGMYPGNAGQLGLEFSGMVVESDSHRSGTEIFGLGRRCFGTMLSTRKEWVAEKPRNTSFED